jgi:phosphatidate cytidylyltransferase
MLKTRILVAVVALPIMVGVTAVGGWLFAAAILGVLLLGGDEYVRLLRQGDYQLPAWLVLALVGLPVAATWFEEPDWRTPGLAILLIAGTLHAIWYMEHGRSQPMLELALAVFGGLYLGWLGSHLLAVRMLEDGAFYVLFLYGCIALSDSGAYFVGRQWGRRRLAPRVSPKKSWEGYAGGLVVTLLFGAIVGGWPSDLPLTTVHGAILGLLIGSLSTIGDLAISALKRQVGAKDSGHLIPGHGGILDRTDTVLIGTTIGYYYLLWFVT